MYAQHVRDEALRLLASGCSLSEVSRRTGVQRSTIREWRARPGARRSCSAAACARCGPALLDQSAYSALLGYYLGDGCISAAKRYFALRISCDRTLPRIIGDVTEMMVRVRPDLRVSHVKGPGVVVVQGNWKHWPCLFPQHGPGRKHERPIVLEDWQRRVVEAHPGPFLRGLFHSDGSRVRNWTRRPVAGVMKRYEYPRWQFTNHSADIRELCCWALDLVEIPWRQSSWRTISVSRRDAVAALDVLIGPKS